MSAFPPLATIERTFQEVRLVPIPEVANFQLLRRSGRTIRRNAWAGRALRDQYMHADETKIVNISTSNSVSRSFPNRLSHRS